MRLKVSIFLENSFETSKRKLKKKRKKRLRGGEGDKDREIARHRERGKEKSVLVLVVILVFECFSFCQTQNSKPETDKANQISEQSFESMHFASSAKVQTKVRFDEQLPSVVLASKYQNDVLLPCKIFDLPAEQTVSA